MDHFKDRKAQGLHLLVGSMAPAEQGLKIGMSHPSDNSDFISPFVLCSIHAACNCVAKSVGQNRDQSMKIIMKDQKCFIWLQEGKVLQSSIAGFGP